MKSNLTFYTRYNPPPSPSADIQGKSLTRQDMKDECDINYILQRVGLGTMALDRAPAVEIDLTNVPDNYQDLVAAIDGARAQFDALPARVRDRFGNNPERFLEFFKSADNTEEAVRLGLAIKRETSDAVPPESKSAE